MRLIKISLKRKITNFIYVLLTLIVSIFTTHAIAELTWQPDLPKAKAAFERETGVSLRAGHRIEPTIFKGYYAIRSGKIGSPSAYFREDMVWLGNIRSPGWSVQSSAENTSASRYTWAQQQLKQLPLEQFILVKRATPPVAIIWSAPDCPYCRLLEKTLEQEKISVYLVPVGIAESGFEQAARIYCSDNPVQAWRAVMLNTATENLSKISCEYPRDMFNDIGFFFGNGRMATPIVIFADGTTITGWKEERRFLLRKKVDDQLFFE